jgi:putative membrane-bound dehydrogenase-like protein
MLGSLGGVLRRLVAGSLMAFPALGLTANLKPSPLTPSEELATLVLADDALMIELVAAEPMVDSPVALAWDADGRLFVADMVDYPTGPMRGHVRRLVDADHDGIYETATVFADNLPFPAGLLPWRNGLLVCASPDILSLQDTDGDGRADTREVILTGFGQGNQQLRVNGLHWGLDNWIYGANGRSDGDIRWAGDPPQTSHSLRGHDFRFRLEPRRLEVVAGRSQFGVTRDDWGHRFLSWNTIPLRQDVVPLKYLEHNPYLPASEGVAGVLPADDTGRIYPLTPPPLTFNRESTAHYNALGGLTVFRGDALGDAYRGNAFMGETLRNLVHRRILEPAGVAFVARRGEQEKEFLASTDPWFHPVNFATGPDGALYVADFYRLFVEHPDFVPKEIRGKVDWRAGSGHGRIWRIRARHQPPRQSGNSLSQASSADLAALLEDPNGWLRDTAQRLLFERQDRSVVAALKSKISTSKLPASNPLSRASDLNAIGRLHALHTLEGLHALEEDVLLAALKDPSAAVREHALRLAESRINGSPEVRNAALALARDSAETVRFQLLLSLGALTDPETKAIREQLAGREATNRWFRIAYLSGTLEKPVPAKIPVASTKGFQPDPAKLARDRTEVVQSFQSALSLAGRADNGAKVFGERCLLCHAIRGRGGAVGPELSGVNTRPKEALLVDILDPGRQVSPDFLAYTLVTTGGETMTGLILSESGGSVTLREPGAADLALPRREIQTLLPSPARSLMPEGLEQGLTPQGLADLLEFLHHPDPHLLPGML